MAKNNIGLMLGLSGVGALVFFLTRSKKAKADTHDDTEPMPADLGAQYMAALANALNTGASFAEYTAILKAAYESGALTRDQIIHYTGKHPDATPEQKANAQLV